MTEDPALSERAFAGDTHGRVPFEAVLHARRADLQAQFAQISPAPQRIVWEIGCGHGHFLAAYAKAHPEQICIGIDIASDRIERANRKRERMALVNLYFLRGDARLFLETLPGTTKLENVFILFPDPWPKLRHRKHRIMQPEFLAQIAARVEEGGRLFFRTDDELYFNEAHALLQRDPKWVVIDEVWRFECETVFQRRAIKFHSLVAQIRSPSL